MEQTDWPEGKLLIVGDEAAMRRTLHTTLYGLGFDVGEAVSKEEALELCRIRQYDAVLLEVSAPGRLGIENYTEFRRLLPQIAILLLGVADRNQERRIEALEAGADYYLTRPFELRELTARLRAALRRVPVTVAGRERVNSVGEISLRPERRLVQKAGCPIHLTPKEFELLHCLMAHPGIPVSYRRLLQMLWGDEYGGHIDCLRTLVRQLRRKIEDSPGTPRYILTESRVGYRFADLDSWRQTEENPGHCVSVNTC